MNNYSVINAEIIYLDNLFLFVAYKKQKIIFYIQKITNSF